MSNPTDTGTDTFLRWFRAITVVGVLFLLGSFVYQSATLDGARYPFKLGLDLAGGSHLVYQADVSSVPASEVPALMGTLREVIERRVNLFGVSEPVVYVERSSFVSDEPMERLVVELPGVTDVAAAVAEIGRTPLLEFKLIDPEAMAAIDSANELASTTATSGAVVSNIRLKVARVFFIY
jgi:preprotein translocase subunit SecD